MKRQIRSILAALLCLAMLAGCGAEPAANVSMGKKADALSVSEARKELDSLLTKVSSSEVKNPQLDIYTD